MEQAEDFRSHMTEMAASRHANLIRVAFTDSTRTLSIVLILVWGLCAGCPFRSFAERNVRAMSEEFTGFNFGKEHGLPDDDVRDILQTRDGSIWILTQQGLARFDGDGFTVFDRANSPEFQSDDPRALAEDKDGHLWVGGKDLLLRMSGNSLRKVPFAGNGRIDHAYQLCPDPSGGMWIGGQSTVARVREQSVTLFDRDSGLDTGGYVRALQVDQSGALFVGTFGGFYRFDTRQQRFEHMESSLLAEGKSVAALALHANRSGRFWAMFGRYNDAKSFHGYRAWISKRDEQSWVNPLTTGTTDFGIGYGHLFILEDSRGRVWLPAPENQLHRLRGGQFETLNLVFPRRPDIATCLREDHEGSLWMGTLNSGLWRWQPRRMQSYSASDGLPHDNVWALCEGSVGDMWVGTDEGLARYADGRWDKWATKQGLSRNSIRALAVDRAGTVWIGTGEGLNSWHEGVLMQHPFPGDWYESKIRVILPTRDGALWVAGAASLHRLTDGQRTKFTVAEGLANNDVRALLEDSAGRLWIGTFGGGLQCYEQGRFTTYSLTNGLASAFVWALHEDAEGGLWIGTESGLHRLRDGRITTIGRAQGLPDNLVNFILEDDHGQLWISHDRGIYRVRRAALNDVADGRTNAVRCVSYTKADGLPSEETNGQKSYPSACKSRDGRLWFATTKGVVVIDPKLHLEEDAPPPVVIERFRATGDLVFTRDPEDPLSPERTLATNSPPGGADFPLAPALNRQGWRLPPGSGRVLEFTYTANTFVSADRKRFKYRLHGLDDKWVDAGNRRQALFTNLKPGNYRFQVIAANHHGVWNETGATCAFQIAPAFHETWWFIVLCGGTMLAAAGAFAIWRLRELRKLHRLERQAAVTSERSRIAQDLHDGLGADLTRLSTLADLASGASGQSSRDYLRKLGQSSREATRGLKDLIWMANPANDTLESFLDRLCQNAEDFLRDARITCRFDIDPNLPPLPLSLDQRRNLLLVAREALNNVIKHSAATEVHVAAHYRAGNLELSIRDNGNGFDTENVRSGTMGLGGMRRRVESAAGKFQLESSPGTGTGIVIQIRWATAEHARPQE